MMPDGTPLPQTRSDGDVISKDRSNSFDEVLPTYTYKRLIDRILEKQASGDPFFSLEFFPPRTANGAVNLISRYVRLNCFVRKHRKVYVVL